MIENAKISNLVVNDKCPNCQTKSIADCVPFFYKEDKPIYLSFYCPECRGVWKKTAKVKLHVDLQ